MNEIILKAVKIHKSYNTGEKTITVLKDLDLEVYSGEILAIMGESGVGKSTLLHILGALDHPTKGKIYYGEEDIFKYSESKLAKLRNEEIGFVFQFHHLLPEFTALENVMMPGLIRRESPAKLKEKALELLDDIGLTHRITHRPNELSGGEKQRLAVARALINSPSLILADEPSGNLDNSTGGNLHDLLWKLNEERNITFIIVTHNPLLAKSAKRTVIMENGRIK